MSDLIQVGASQVSEDQARRDVESVFGGGGREVDPETAVTIASWWQSSGAIGRVLAGFASGASVSKDDLLDDIAATRNAHGYHTLDMLPPDRRALDCLSTFVINYQREGR